MPRGKKKVVESTANPVVAAEAAAPKKPAARVGRPRKSKPEEVVDRAASKTAPVIDQPLSAQTVVDAVVSDERQAKPRKAYPTHDERIALADKKIERLNKLNAEREKLIKATEEKLATRKAALENGYEAIKQAAAKKERIIAAKEKAAMTAVEKAAKKAEDKLKLNKLLDALKAKGKSIDDLLEELTHKGE